MNRIYKVIWSKTRNCYVAVSEMAKNNSKSSVRSERRGLIKGASALALCLALSVGISSSAWASYQAGPNINTSGSSEFTVVGDGNEVVVTTYGSAFGYHASIIDAEYSTSIGAYSIVGIPRKYQSMEGDTAIGAYSKIESGSYNTAVGYRSQASGGGNNTAYGAGSHTGEHTPAVNDKNTAPASAPRTRAPAK